MDVTARNRLVKAAGWCAALAPIALLLADALRHRLGANPIAEVLNRLGFWTLTFLTLALAPTPLQRWAGLTWPLRLRRLLGVTAACYASLHFAWYLGVDQFFDLAVVWADVSKRPFITVGFATLLLLLPLAITSTDGWVRRLGFARWKALHRLVYVAAAARRDPLPLAGQGRPAGPEPLRAGGGGAAAAPAGAAPPAAGRLTVSAAGGARPPRAAGRCRTAWA